MLIPTSKVSADFNSSINAASIAGTERRNENSPAVSRVKPENREAEIVLPEREIPGITPIPCAAPTAKADTIEGSFFVF